MTRRPPSHDPAGTGEVMDAAARGEEEDDEASSGDTPLDVAAEEQAWDEAMHQAVSLAKAQGHRPGRIEETLRDAHRSRLDWRVLLRQYLVSAARDDYRWSVPNRRFIDAGSTSRRCTARASTPSRCSSTPRTRSTPPPWPRSGPSCAPWPKRSGPTPSPWCRSTPRCRTPPSHRFGDLPEELVAKGRGGTDFRPGFAWLDREGITPPVLPLPHRHGVRPLPRGAAALPGAVVQLGAGASRVPARALGRTHRPRPVGPAPA